MGIITIDSLTAGMRLLQDVVDHNGRKLFAAGCTVDENALRIMKIWGITQVDVEGVKAENANEALLANVPEDILLLAEEHTNFRFMHTDRQHPATEELFKQSLLRTISLIQLHGKEMLSPVKLQDDHAAQAPPPEDIATVLKREVSVGSMPSVFHRLVEVVNDSRSSSSDVAEVITHDTDLTARLLRIANSPLFAFSTKIDTISRAVTIIGTNQLISLAMGISILSKFKGVPENMVTMRQFWEHSVACGVAARTLASHQQMQNTERFFVAGLLHDIGRLVMYTLLPQHATALLKRAQDEKKYLHQLEKDVIGFTHDRLGGFLLKEWKCPVSLEKNVRYHHYPLQAPNQIEPAIIHVADILAHALLYGCNGEQLVPRLNPAAWDALNIQPSALAQLATQMNFQVGDIVRLMGVND